LTQASLAKTVGISASTISSVLKGTRSLTKQQMLKLAKHFDVNPSVFLPAPG
jgi:plasmid maintenance system antidote protein VapI